MSGFIEKNLAAISDFFEHSILRESSVGRKGFLQAADARVKLIALLGFIILVSLTKEVGLLLILTAIPFILAATSRINIAGFAKRVFVFIPLFTVVIAVPALFTVPGTPVVNVGRFTITHEGLHSALFLILRVSASISATILLILSTGWDNILLSLKKLHFPETFVSLLGISYRYIHLLLRSLHEILEARKSRVITRLPFNKNASIFAQSSSYLFLKTLHLAEGVQMAIASRGGGHGFESNRSSGDAKPVSSGIEYPSGGGFGGNGKAVKRSSGGPGKVPAPTDNENADRGLEIVFRLENVNYQYPGGIKGVEIAKLEIEANKCTVLLGANGSGKSTLLKMMDGLIFPQAGSIEAFGRKLTERNLEAGEFNRFFRGKVGLVFQDPDIQCFSPTVYEELAFGPRQKGLSEDEVQKRVLDMMRLLKIENLSRRYPYNLSGGEKKRVAIASVLTVDPDVHLMDEPTGGLDPLTEGILIDVIFELKERGKTIVVATQDLILARHIADNAVILGPEKNLLSYGGAEEILENRELLRKANLVHAHRFPHKKGKAPLYHSHYLED